MATIDVHVVTPDREVWAGEATFVVARSNDGDMGVLPGHVPTLATLRKGPFRIETADGRVETGQIDGGFLSVGEAPDGGTRVDILAEQVSAPSEEEPGQTH
jgi:F-type H+-transporting ATPase subunit epsilon